MAAKDSQRGVVLEETHSPQSSSSFFSPSSSCNFSPLLISRQASTTVSVSSRPFENCKESIQYPSCVTTETYSEGSSSCMEYKLSSSPSSTINKHLSTQQSISSQANFSNSFPSSKTSFKKTSFSKKGPSKSISGKKCLQVKTANNLLGSSAQISPSILRKPTRNSQSTNLSITSKRVQFTPSHSNSKASDNICSFAHQNKSTSERFSKQPSPTNSSCAFTALPASTVTVLKSPTKSPTPTQYLLFPQNPQNLTETGPVSNQTNQSASSAAQMNPLSTASGPTPKYSWDESLQQLSKGLRKICGSPDAISLKSFKRACSLTGDSRRQNPLSAPVSNSQRNLSELLSSPRKGSRFKRVLSHSPTAIACKHEDLYRHIPTKNALINADPKHRLVHPPDSIDTKGDRQSAPPAASTAAGGMTPPCETIIANTQAKEATANPSVSPNNPRSKSA